MEAEARYTFVGAALLALLAAVAAGLVWLQDTGSRREFAYYNIFFENQSLDGLSQGGEVAVRGIKVGRVAFARGANTGDIEILMLGQHFVDVIVAMRDIPPGLERRAPLRIGLHAGNYAYATPGKSSRVGAYITVFSVYIVTARNHSTSDYRGSDRRVRQQNTRRENRRLPSHDGTCG